VSVQLAHPFAAIQVAPGATPMCAPSPPSPTMVPIVCVPWMSRSQIVPVRHTCAMSYQLWSSTTEPSACAPRKRPLSAGWEASTPVSMFATTMPSPVMPCAHASGAPISATPQATPSSRPCVPVARAESTGCSRL